MTPPLVQSTNGSAPNGISLTLTLGATPVPGNELVIVGWGSGASGLVLPAGFTVHATDPTPDNLVHIVIAYRVVQAGDGVAWTSAAGGGHDRFLVLMEFAGVGLPLTPSTATLAGGAGIGPLSVSPSGAGPFVVGGFVENDGGHGSDVYWTAGTITSKGAGNAPNLLGEGPFGMGGYATADPLTATRNVPGDGNPALALAAVLPAADPPTADFSATPRAGDPPLTVAFTDLSTGAPTSWAWDFGDGGTSTSENPTHVYAAHGSYTVTLTATNAYGSDTASKTGYIVVAHNSILLDVWAPQPDGSITFLGTLSGAFDKVIRPEQNAVGSGSFSIRRDDPDATATNIAAGNLVKVRVPEVDADPIFAFFMETISTDVISTDEQGGEIIHVAGDGALKYWDWARWLAVSYVLPWWDSGWPDLVAGKPPAGAIGHVALVTGDYWVYTITNGKVASRTSVHYSAFQAFYSSRRQYKAATGMSLAGGVATLVHLSTSAHSGIYLHPMDPGITEVSATSVLGLRPEFGDIGASTVTQWWDSAWGTPPGGTMGRVVLAAGTYRHYTVSGGRCTYAGMVTTGGLAAWYDSRASYRFASGTAVATLVHLSSGVISGEYLHPMDPGIREYVASTPIVSLVPGKVLYRIAEEVQNADRPSQPMPLLSYAFTATEDSAGDDWTNTDSLAGFTASVGDSYLATVLAIVSTGVVDVEMSPDLVFQAWNEQGRDLTGAAFASDVVRFEKNVNIAAALKREGTAGPVPTFTQVVGSTGGWAEATLPDAASRVTRETSTQAQTDDDTALADLGLADLLSRLRRSDAAGFNIAVGNDPTNGLYLPGPPGSANGSFWLGDIVTLHTGSDTADFDEASVRIAAITISETESGDLIVIPEVSSSLGAAEDAAFPGSSSGSSGSSGGSISGIVTSSNDLSGYQLLAEKGIASGYADLDASGLVPLAELGTGTPDGTKFLRDDQTFAVPPGGGTIPGVYDANASPYSCVPNASGHDNRDGITSAIADAMTWAAAHDGIGVVEFDSGEYYINGALQTSVGNAYAQIPIPSVAGTAEKVTLILRSKVGDYMSWPGGAQTVVQPGVVIFRSTITGSYSGTYGTPAILGGPDPKRAGGTFSNVRLETHGIQFRQPSNPSLCCINAQRINQLVVENIGCDTTDVVGSIVQPTHPTGIAVLVPEVNNNAWVEYRGSNFAMGYYAGFGLSESTRGGHLLAYQCYVAFNVQGDYYGTAHIDVLDSVWCPYGLATVDPSSGIANPAATANGYCLIVIDYLGFEDAATGWGVPTYHVNDPTNHYFGRVAYMRNLAGVGTQTGPLTVNGATNLARDDLTVLPAGGAAFATPAIVLGTAAAAGAATTVIRSDSTIVAFDVTVPVTQALGDSAATGSAVVSARRDHKHGMPALSTATPLIESGSGTAGSGTLSSRDDHIHPVSASSGGVGELLISDTPAGSPLVFGDLLQNEAGTDLLYSG